MATKKHYAFVIDVSRCIDCRSCQVACSVENNVPMNNTRIWVNDLGVQGEFPKLERTFLPYNCMHCDQPPCVQVCVSGATFKDKVSGLVLVDQDACIGCGFCVDACPYNARYLNKERGVVDKCNACVQRLDQGMQPACVATCVGKSRVFGDLNDPESEASVALRNAHDILRLEVETNGVDTDPNIFYINSPMMKELNLPISTGQPLVSQMGVLPRDPKYTIAEIGWKKVLVPLVGLGIGASFLVQATYFGKQLLEGEKEFDE